MNLNKLFLNHCKKNNLEVNPNQLNLIEDLESFYNLNFNKSFFKKIFSKKDNKIGGTIPTSLLALTNLADLKLDFLHTAAMPGGVRHDPNIGRAAALHARLQVHQITIG